jgi:hypothetical protein
MPVAAPVHRLIVPLPTVASVRTAYLAHRERCNGCTTKATCRDGLRLAAAYAGLVSRDPQYSEQLARTDRQMEQLAEMAARAVREQRPQEWQKYLPAVEAADNSRLPVAESVVMPIKSTTMPVGTPTTATNIDQKRESQKKS